MGRLPRQPYRKIHNYKNNNLEITSMTLYELMDTYFTAVNTFFMILLFYKTTKT